ncbi:mycothiol synthase [Leucobacter denitrificans]|uniref:Mycothiol synthase n=1 Tax=Leucobacter denitrificans TaxID=683042 RepID=A0A7G9S3S1_9MICO|nr:mycothiol synthase [Leucobacter denitrificans]QNN62496.1 mycothiol synthase [Leucobacter denitrificans]
MVAVVAGAAGIEDARPLLDRAERFDGSSPISDQALLAVSQHQRDLWLFTEQGTDNAEVTAPIAVGVLGQGEVDLVVDPRERGRGVGSAALGTLLEKAPDALLAWAHGDNPAADALLAGAGFSPIRSLFRMALDPAKLPTANSNPYATKLPEGFTLRSFGGADDPAEWVRVNAAAFADHPEQGRVTEADFALMREEPWFDPHDLLLLEDADVRLAGFTWIKTVVDSDDEATGTETELYAIGVDPEHAGLGLGRALLDATLARMATHSPERVTLYVDGENERAVRMYEAVGFTVDSRSRQWRRGARIGS